ncbi:hypothetical protein [Dehalococcoides mccartyi]|uniref:Uncharacterized protein n=1 Tax=Dehalococcoides mccartyi (strain ATCC BAA-2266 / KCTC 15142 / 195) TaxID=243164 RepID=Q3Z6H4_DEHM1|nr:hypothetical protein [Dehalococcoides mccartyi]AAW39344.1 hypothetical protein DET1475 [Dehalococcoides mccartyi 195]
MAYSEMKRQPRAKVMLPAIRELIVIRALENRDKDRTLLAQELREEIENKFPKEIPPTEETLIKRISEARTKANDPRDDSWHLGTVDKYPVSVPAIPFILQVQASNPTTKISIRRAHWIDVLHTSVKDIALLSDISHHYTFYEKISELAQTAFNTARFDALLVSQDKQKSLLKLFMEMQKDVEWDTRHRVFKHVTGSEMANIIESIAFRGDMAFGINPFKTEIKLGTKEELLSLCKSNKAIKDSDQISAVDFILTLSRPILILDGIKPIFIDDISGLKR